jgi:hypothetical protein
MIIVGLSLVYRRTIEGLLDKLGIIKSLAKAHQATEYAPNELVLVCEHENAYSPHRGRILTPPPERRIYPAVPVPLARLPDESGVPVGVATRLGGGAEMRHRTALEAC